jgi:hypothetical protein
LKISFRGFTMDHKTKVKVMKYLIAVLALVPVYVFSGMLAVAADSPKVEKDETPQVYWTKKPVQCGSPGSLIELVKSYGEIPLLTADGISTAGNGQVVKIKVIFAVNPISKSWTMIEVNSPTQACVLSNGEGFNINKLPAPKQETKLNVSRKL